MAYSLRLPDTLDAAARAKADYLGISLNALVCVALDAYLRSPGEPATPRSEPEPKPAKPSEKPVEQPVQTASAPQPKPDKPIPKVGKKGWRERQRERDTAFR